MSWPENNIVMGVDLSHESIPMAQLDAWDLERKNEKLLEENARLRKVLVLARENLELGIAGLNQLQLLDLINEALGDKA